MASTPTPNSIFGKVPPCSDWLVIDHPPGCWRKVNHEFRLAAPAFRTKALVSEYPLRSDDAALQLMRDRYNNFD